MFKQLFEIFVGDMTPEQKRFLIRLGFRFLLVFHIAWACGWLQFMGLTGFAQAGELADVKSDLATLMIKQNIETRTSFETEIKRIDQEIFNAEAKIIEARDNPPLAQVHSERLSELRSERGRVQRRLEAFLRANPGIAGVEF